MNKTLKNYLKSILAFCLIASAITIVFFDAKKIENGWFHPELGVCHLKFLSDATVDHIELSFRLQEFKKIFWWETKFDGCQNRILAGLYDIFNIKFRAWLFQFIPPNPAISFSWVFTLVLIPLLLFNFILQYFKMDIFSASLVTVFYLFSVTTVGNTFQLFHPGKILVSLSFVVLLNLFVFVDRLQAWGFKNKWPLLLMTSVSLYLNFFIDPYQYAILLIIPLLFPQLFFNCQFKYHPSSGFFQNVKSLFHTKDFSAQLIYACSVIGFLMTVFVFLPAIFKSAGYHYQFMSSFQGQMKADASLKMPLLYLFSWKYYLRFLLNLNWFVLNNIGLRQIFPQFHADLWGVEAKGWFEMLRFGNIFLFSFFHVIFWGFILWLRRKKQLTNEVLKFIFGLFICAAWITLIHCHQFFIVPHATYIYGSIFTLFFVIFLAYLLNACKHNKRVYVMFVLCLLVVSIANYNAAKELNLQIKHIWHGNWKHVDGRYREYAKVWKVLKYDGRTIKGDWTRIDPNVKDAFLKVKISQGPVYSILWQHLVGNLNHQFAIHFAAFDKRQKEEKK
ncbi:hypothetical protein ACFL49_02125 [Candidatus Omnitrophota bacterium]